MAAVTDPSPDPVVVGGTRRGWEIGAAAALLALALVVIMESLRIGAGYTFAGPATGFFPFVVAVPLVVTAGTALWQALHLRSQKPIFDSADDVVEFVKVGVPLAVAVISIAWLGFYLATAAYIGFFTAWYGRYRWWAVLLAALLSPVAFYVVFERMFSISLPKSLFYSPAIPF